LERDLASKHGEHFRQPRPFASLGDTIILGNGINDLVNADFSSGDTIILGNGAGDTVSAHDSSNDKITLGNGAGDTVNANNFANIARSKISVTPTNAMSPAPLPRVIVLRADRVAGAIAESNLIVAAFER
jgi:hypothetical protein